MPLNRRDLFNGSLALAGGAGLAGFGPAPGATIPAGFSGGQSVPVDLEYRADVSSASLESRLQASRRSFRPDVQYFRTGGFAEPGDGGGALYRRVGIEPGGAGKVRSADGAWWKLSDPSPNVRQFAARGDGHANDAPAINAALNLMNTTVEGSFQMNLPDGAYLLDGDGQRLLEVQNGTKVKGSSLEGTILRVQKTARTVSILEDSGNAAKIEIEGLTIHGSGNPTATSGLRLGHRGIQFGTYGKLADVTVRDLPNAVAFDLNTNILVGGALYSLDTKSGLVNHLGASGLHLQAMTPYNFTDVGVQMSAGDHISFVECEAPGSDEAVAIRFARGGTVGSFILAVQSGRTVKTPVEIDPVSVVDWFLGPTTLFLYGSAAYGDAAHPGDHGAATALGLQTLTCAGKNWALDQFKGGALFITGGAGKDQWRRVVGNTRDTLSIAGYWDVVPDVGSTFAVDYFIKKTGGGGYAHSRSGSAPDMALERVSVTGAARLNQVTIGRSNAAAELKDIFRAVATLDFPEIAGGSVQQLDIALADADPLTCSLMGVTAPAEIQRQASLTVSAAIVSGGVRVFVKNHGDRAINPVTGLFSVLVARV